MSAFISASQLEYRANLLALHSIFDPLVLAQWANEASAPGIEQVNQKVGNLDQMRQQNAALAEESAAAAVKRNQTQHLAERNWSRGSV